MSAIYRRRAFIKLFAAAVAGGVGFFSGISCGYAADAAGPRVIVWDGPGGDVTASADYEVTVRIAGKEWKPFIYSSYNRPYDKLLDSEGKYIKLSFLALHSNEYKRPETNKDTYAHSWTHFDFAGGPVEVEVKIRKPLDGLTLPLRSCGIFPSTLGIKSKVVAGDTIRFTLDKPAKIAVVPNHLQALEKLKDGKSISVAEK